MISNSYKMKYNLKTQQRIVRNILFLLCMAVALSSGLSSCKSKKKLAREEAAAAQARKIAKAKADLESVLTDDSQTIAEKEGIISAVKAAEIDDAEVKALLDKAELHVAQLKEAQLAKENAERLAREREERLKNESGQKSLDQYFTSIANAAGAAEANQLINEALKQFASPETTVLIIIGKFGGEPDYDRPTTISKYLNYLKDQKKSPNKVENVVLDANGKIKELELIKK